MGQKQRRQLASLRRQLDQAARWMVNHEVYAHEYARALEEGLAAARRANVLLEQRIRLEAERSLGSVFAVAPTVDEPQVWTIHVHMSKIPRSVSLESIEPLLATCFRHSLLALHQAAGTTPPPLEKPDVRRTNPGRRA
jgi:hypothetical protein